VTVKESTSDLDDVDAGWDAHDAVDEEGDDEDDLDAGWDDVPLGAPPTGDAGRRGLTEEERAARAARAASRKERQRKKAADKTERRRARQAAANAKQKKARGRTDRVRPDARNREEEARGQTAPRMVPPAEVDSKPAAVSAPRSWRPLGILAAILAAVATITLLWLRR